MAYSFLHTALEFCEKARINELMQEKSREMADKRKSHILPRVEELKDFLPPPLDYSMNLETIGAEWWAERDRQLEHCRTTGNEHPCVMAWTAGPEVRVNLIICSSLLYFQTFLNIVRTLSNPSFALIRYL
jgi:hypothetical protein